MAFLSKLFGRREPVVAELRWLPPYGSFVQAIVGEASYQPALQAIVATDGDMFPVLLTREPTNPYDALAIVARHPTHGPIGYLAREIAAQCNGGLLAFGGAGWCRARAWTGDGLSIGVWLDVDLKPFGLILPWMNSQQREAHVHRPPSDPVRERFEAFRARCSSTPLDGHRLVFTGVLDHWDRDQVEVLVRHLGSRTSSSLSAKTTLLVAGVRPGPAKLRHAAELGCRVISEEDFIAEVLDPPCAAWEAKA